MELDGCPLPEDRYYHFEESIWVQPGPGEGVWTLGLIASLVAFAGRFSSVSYRPVEGVRPAGSSVATVESVRYTGPVRIPVEGEVLDRNGALPARPKLLNDAPYTEGWIVRFRPTVARLERPPLEPAGAIAERLRARIHELRIHCYPAAPDLEIIELGTECSATLARLDDELARRPSGEVILLVTDDPTSPIELVRWSDRTGYPILAHRPEGSLHHFLIRKEARPRPRGRDPETGAIRPG